MPISGQFAFGLPTREPTLSIIDAPDDRYLPGFRNGLKAVGPRLIETRIAVSSYGLPIVISAGSRRLPGNIVWARPFTEYKQTKTTADNQPIDFNLLGINEPPRLSSVKITLYHYYATAFLIFGESLSLTGNDLELRKIWADGDLILDNTSSGKKAAKGINYRFYTGNDNQPVDPTMLFFDGADKTPAYLGVIGLMLVDLPLAAFGNKFPAITIEVAEKGVVSAAFVQSLPATGENNNEYQVFCDFNTNRAYVGNSTGEDSLYTFDILTSSFLKSVKLNQGGVLQDGTLKKGFNAVKPWFYAPWLKRIIGFPDLGIDLTPFAARTDTGAVTSYSVGSIRSHVRSGALGRIQLNDTTNLTVIATAASSDNLDIVAISNSGDSMWKIDTLLGANSLDNLGYATDSLLCFATSTPISIDLYAVRDGLNTVDICPLTLAQLAPTAALPITIVQNKIPYDGIAVTFVTILKYYEAQNALIIGYNSGELRMVSLNTFTNIWRITTPLATMPPRGMEGDLSSGTYAWAGSGTNLYELNLNSGIVSTFVIPSGILGTAGSWSHGPSRSVFGFHVSLRTLNRVYFATNADDDLLLSDFIKMIAIRSNFLLSELSIHASVTTTIQGAIITEPTSFSELMENIKSVYGLDVNADSGIISVKDNTINYVTPAFTIDDSHLLNQDSNETFRWRREEEIQLPKTMTLTYIDPAIGYQWSTMTIARNGETLVTKSENKNRFTVPFIMAAARAKLLAHKALWNVWSSRMSYSFSLAREFLELEPGDLIAANIDSKNLLIRSMEVTYNNNLTINVNAVDFQDWQEFFIEAYPGQPYNPLVEVFVNAEVIYLDIPLLKAGDDVASIGDLSRFYYTIVPTTITNTLVETTAFESIDSGLNYRQLNSSNFAVPVGSLITKFGKPIVAHSIDYINTIKFQLIGGDAALLASITLANMLLGGNLAAVGAPGRWEIIRFTTVTLELDGTYTISVIMRGCNHTDYINQMMISEKEQARGSNGSPTSLPLAGSYTDYVNAPHKEGDYFVLLNNQWLKTATRDNPVDSKLLSRFAVSRTGLNATTDRTIVANDNAPAPCASVRIFRNNLGILTVTWRESYRNGFPLINGENYPTMAEGDLSEYQILIYPPTTLALDTFLNGNRLFLTDTTWQGLQFDGLNSRTSDILKFGDASVNPAFSGVAVANTGLWVADVAGAAAAARSYSFPLPLYSTAAHTLAPGTLSGVVAPAEQARLAYDYLWCGVRQKSAIVAPDGKRALKKKVPKLLVGVDYTNAFSTIQPDRTERYGNTYLTRVYIEDV